MVELLIKKHCVSHLLLAIDSLGTHRIETAKVDFVSKWKWNEKSEQTERAIWDNKYVQRRWILARFIYIVPISADFEYITCVCVYERNFSFGLNAIGWPCSRSREVISKRFCVCFVNLSFLNIMLPSSSLPPRIYVINRQIYHFLLYTLSHCGRN